MTVMLGVVLLYTILGGMVSVLITDYLQFVIMALSLVVVSLFLMSQLGWQRIVDGVAVLKGESGFDPIKNADYGVSLHGLDVVPRPGVVRLVANGRDPCFVAEDQKAVRQTFTWGSVGFLIRFMVPYFWGFGALVYIGGQPGLREAFLPAASRPPRETTLSAMPVALGQLLPTGMLGLLMAGMAGRGHVRIQHLHSLLGALVSIARDVLYV